MTEFAERANSMGRTASAVLLGFTLFAGTIGGWIVLPKGAPAGDVAVVLWLNVAIVLTAIVVEARRRPYSLHLMHLVCMYLFMGAASLFQYSVGTLGVAGSINMVKGELLAAALAVSLWLLGYLSGYEFHHRFFAPRGVGAMGRFLMRPLTPGRVKIGLFAGLLVLVYLAVLGLAGVGTRMASREALEEHAVRAGASAFTQAYFLIHMWILRAFPMVALVAGMLLFGRNWRNRSLTLLLLILALAVGNAFANNPFAAPRMWFATAIFAFVSPFLLRRLSTGWAVVAIAVTGLTVLPALNWNRYAASFNELVDYFALVSPVDYLAHSSDVDSLGMTALCVRWVEAHGHRYGLQIAGALFSWFPRVFWPSKPIGTGKMVTEDLGFGFTNLSPSIPAEALVDFGLIGVPFFAAVVGVLFSRLDYIYWVRDRVAGRATVSVIELIYPFWIGCVIYITRGDMFGAFTMTAGFTVCILPFTLGMTRATWRSGRATAPEAPT
jgi:hypothetical protein